jgi:hypothetical protein
MPINTAAATTGRDISKRVLLALFMASAALAPATPARAAAGPNPAATASLPPAAILLPAVPAPAGQMGYYMMQGSRIISPVYTSGPACQKALVVLLKSVPPTVAPVVCAHRAP